MPTQQIGVSAGNPRRRRDECVALTGWSLAATWLTAGLLVAALLLAPALANADERFQKLRTGLSLAEASASTENYPTSGLDLMPGGTINSSAEMIFRPIKRVAYSHTHESTTGQFLNESTSFPSSKRALPRNW